MSYEWVEDRAVSNLRKHGIPFDYATGVFLDEFRVERLDSDAANDEDRWIVIGLVDKDEVTVVTTDAATPSD